MKNRIREFRLAKGLDQVDLGGLVNLSRSTIGFWEKGLKLFWLSRLFVVCEILRAPIEEVFEPRETEGSIEVENKVSCFRKKLGLSQQEVASKMGISRQAFSAFERGLKAGGYGSLPKIYELAKVLEVSVGELFPVELRGSEGDCC